MTLARRRAVHRTRVLAVTAVVVLAAALAGIVGGSYETSLADVRDAVLGTASTRTVVIVVDMRLPRVLAGLLARRKDKGAIDERHAGELRAKRDR